MESLVPELEGLWRRQPHSSSNESYHRGRAVFYWRFTHQAFVYAWTYKVRLDSKADHLINTRGHVCYYVTSEQKKNVFTGDTLFIAGCGRFFEGTPQDMHSSLSKLADLPDDTNVWCGHEYTKVLS